MLVTLPQGGMVTLGLRKACCSQHSFALGSEEQSPKETADHVFWIRCWKPGFGGVQMLSYIHPQALGNCGCACKVTKSESDPWNPPSLDEGAKEGQ